MRLRPPAEVRRRAAGDRVLAWIPVGSSSVIATDRALVLAEGVTPERIPWDLVLRVAWEPDHVEITAQDSVGGRPSVHRVDVVGELGAFPGVLRERVTSSIVIQRHVDLDGSLGVRLLARRVPGTTDLRWSVVFDAGLDPREPALRARADDALADLRSSLGI